MGMTLFPQSVTYVIALIKCLLISAHVIEMGLTWIE